LFSYLFGLPLLNYKLHKSKKARVKQKKQKQKFSRISATNNMRNKGESLPLTAARCALVIFKVMLRERVESTKDYSPTRF